MSEMAYVGAWGRRWVLPLFLTKANKYPVGIAFVLFAAAIYLGTNHYPVFPPQLLPMTWLDRAIPFLPITIWVYLSEYVYFFLVYFVCKDMVNANKYLYSFFALQVTSALIFMAWPTTYPRELFPISPDMLDSLSYAAFSSLRNIDSPGNCCPSLHVSSVFLSAFIFIDDQPKKFPFFFIWGCAIALSTLTTKQHYIVDVVSGMVLAVGFYLLFHKLVSYRR